MGKKRKPASTRTATPVGGDIATATRSAYDQRVEANKAQNQRVIDALRRNNSGWLFWAGDGVAAV
jgi:hypothetical protein